jgi:hypothetical protein
MVIVGLQAGRGIGPTERRVIDPILAHPYVHSLWLTVPRYPDVEHTKLRVIVEPSQGHHMLYASRNRMMARIRAQIRLLSRPIDYVLMGDDDGIPDGDYFDILAGLPKTNEPILYTGKLSNANGARWYDIAAFVGTQPVAIPYDSWDHPRWDENRYANGNQHILNMAAWNLGVDYPAHAGEDPWFCWALVRAGARIQFVPELHMTLARQHPPCCVWENGRTTSVG